MDITKLNNVTKVVNENGIMSFQATPGTKVEKMHKDEYLIDCGASKELFQHFWNILSDEPFLAKQYLNNYTDYCIVFNKLAKWSGWCNKSYYNMYYTFIKEFDGVNDAKLIHDTINELRWKNEKSDDSAPKITPQVVIKTDKSIIEKIAKPARDSRGRFLGNKKLSKNKPKVGAKSADPVVKYRVASFNYQDNDGKMSYNRRVAVTQTNIDYIFGYDIYRQEPRQFKKEKISSLKIKFEEISDLPVEYKLKVISNAEYYIEPTSKENRREYTKYTFVNRENGAGYFMTWDGNKRQIINLHGFLSDAEQFNYRKVLKATAENYQNEK